MNNLKTTLRHAGVASSFSNQGNYIISTVKTRSGFETVLKVQGQFNEYICLIGALNSKGAMSNHIAMTRMAISSDINDWTKENAFTFSPKAILDGIEKMNLKYDANNLNCELCEQFLLMSGINYSSSQESFGQMILTCAIVVLFILVLYFIFK
ncbi:hypothetical protein [Candidatus Methylopumilus planktonicus]|uniref:hypothetical protein n=1 Tax=Candidatus Methylopumilus planktonicus TaxID=1581557 RepID=UPI003BEF0D18